jgi:hypothetical protein
MRDADNIYAKELQEIHQSPNQSYITLVGMQRNLLSQESADKGKQPHSSGCNCDPSRTLSEESYEEFLVSSANLQ